jgi:hypothetical protein
VWRRQVGFVHWTRWPAESSTGCMVQERQDEVKDSFLVEPQNQGRAGTTWEPSHEWRLAEATPSSRSFWLFTRKPLGSLVDPQSQDRRIEDEGATASDRSDRSDRWVPV